MSDSSPDTDILFSSPDSPDRKVTAAGLSFLAMNARQVSFDEIMSMGFYCHFHNRNSNTIYQIRKLPRRV